MTGIPSDTLHELRRTLLECEEYFGSNANLRGLFSDKAIAPFRAGLPERDSLMARVDATIAHLVNKKRADGRSALTLFLHSLSQKYDSADQRHTALQALVNSLSPSAASQPPISQWHTEAIRALLVAALDDQTLTALAFDHFRAVHDDFSDGLTRSHKIQILLEYCLRHNQVELLLAQLQRLNPHQYRQHQPYRVPVTAVTNTPSDSLATTNPTDATYRATDPFTNYENGLRQLETAVQNDHKAQNEISVFAQRLRENINHSRRYGDTSDRRADRAEIIDSLNRLARHITPKSFEDWCQNP